MSNDNEGCKRPLDLLYIRTAYCECCGEPIQVNYASRRYVVMQKMFCSAGCKQTYDDHIENVNLQMSTPDLWKPQRS